MIRFDIQLPRVGRKRLITTSVMTSTASALWLSAPLWVDRIPLLPDADLSLPLVASGILLPAWIGFSTLLLAEQRIRDERGYWTAVQAARRAIARVRPAGVISLDDEAAR